MSNKENTDKKNRIKYIFTFFLSLFLSIILVTKLYNLGKNIIYPILGAIFGIILPAIDLIFKLMDIEIPSYFNFLSNSTKKCFFWYVWGLHLEALLFLYKIIIKK